MKCLFTLAACLLVMTAVSQSYEKYASDAFVLMRMAQTMHVQPKPMNEAFSEQMFDYFFDRLDRKKVVFTSEDFASLLDYRTKLAEEVLQKKTGFLKLVTGIYEKRMRMIDSFFSTIEKQPVNFNIAETFTVNEDTTWPEQPQAQQQKLQKLLKKTMLAHMLSRLDISENITAGRQKILIDSLEPAVRKKITASFKRGFKRIQEGVTGLNALTGNLYCAALAHSFDPHTGYMPRTEKENFESMLGNKSMRFGFSIEEKDEVVFIRDLRPGSPAYKSGQLNKGDKIMSLQWEGKNEIDVSEADLEEVSVMLAETNYGKMIMTVQKADGLLKKVELQKEAVTPDDEDEKVKSFILKNGNQSVGYISLPAFYTDFDDLFNNVKGCANDVAKAVLQLKKENISGLILDLRYNGGGSMQEAIELSGIFIDAGPVGQSVYTGGKLSTQKDINRGTIYDGPLVLLVNGASASASEMVAGTLQDYHRAIIMGTPTYGKATSQIILPLDTSKNIQSASNPLSLSFVKLTTGKLYRVTGNSLQAKGVMPDIHLPDIVESVIPKESSEPNALKAEPIAANQFYKPYGRDKILPFIKTGVTITDTSAWFASARKNAVLMKEMSEETDISLRWQDAIQKWQQDKATTTSIRTKEYSNGDRFRIENTELEEQRLKLVPDMKELNNQWKNNMLKDAWVSTAFMVLSSSK